MEGRSDGQSVKFMIERMAPKRVAFVHGSHSAATKLRTKLTSKTTPKDSIFLPKRGDSIEMRSDTKTFHIKMDESLLNNLRMKKIVGGDYEVARFQGVMRYPTPEELAQSAEATAQGNDDPGEDNDAEKAEEVDTAGKESDRQIMLFANAAGVAGEKSGAVGEYDEKSLVDGRSAKEAGDIVDTSESGGFWIGMGELKLSDIRARLRDVGVRAEIKPGGILVCEGNVAITKAGPYNFSVDGVVGETYYRIREVIYQVLTYVR